MKRTPRVLDVRDDLERAREAADPDVAEELADVRDRLDVLDDRSREGRGIEDVLDVVDNELLALEERVDGVPAQRLQAARNRIELYRDAQSDSIGGVTVLDATLRREDHPSRTGTGATLVVTLIGEDEPRDLHLVATFYDEEGDVLDDVRVADVSIDAGEQVTVEERVEVPAGVSYFAVSPRQSGTVPAADGDER